MKNSNAQTEASVEKTTEVLKAIDKIAEEHDLEYIVYIQGENTAAFASKVDNVERMSNVLAQALYKAIMADELPANSDDFVQTFVGAAYCLINQLKRVSQNVASDN